MSELYRDFIDRKADSIINSLGGTITPAPANAELYRDFLDRKFNDVIAGLINVLPIGTASGNPATFNTSLSLPLVSCKTNFMCIQASGTPSPSNPLPITGVDDITLTVNGNNVVIDLDGTRYGGYVDVVNSKLVLNRVRVVLSDLSWSYNSNNNRYYATPTLKPKEIINTSDIAPMCDIFKGIKTTPFSDNSIMNGWSGNYRSYLVVYSTSITSLTDFNNTISGHEVVYTVQDSQIIEIPLSDIPTLSTIIGNNSFASDSGNIDIKYRCLPIDLI